MPASDDYIAHVRSSLREAREGAPLSALVATRKAIILIDNLVEERDALRQVIVRQEQALARAQLENQRDPQLPDSR